jgi:hypothetical protein
MLLNFRPRLITPVIYGMLGILTFAHFDFPQWLSDLLWPIRGVLFGAMFFTLLDWMKSSILDGWDRAMRRQVETKASHLANMLRYMTPEQLEMLRATLTIGEAHPSEPDGSTVVDGVTIPDEWLQKHFKDALGTALPPVRKYPEGSMDRMYASHLHYYLVKQGAATAATGNQPTKVKSWPDVNKALGWTW